MKKTRWTALVLVALVTASLVDAAPLAKPVAGQQQAWLTSSSGVVEVYFKGDPGWTNAEDRMILHPGDQVRTMSGRVQVVMEDKSVIVLGPSTLIEIQALQLDKVSGIRNTLVKLTSGLLKAVVAKFDKKSTFEIHTATAIAAVKGTEFFCEASEKATRVVCREGLVLLSDLRREKELALKESQAGVFSGIDLKPEKIELKDIDQLQRQLDDLDLKKKGERRGFDPDRERAELMREVRETLVNAIVEFKQDQAERIADARFGKALVDMNGYRVRMDEYILRPQPQRVEFLNITQRTDGPNKGLTSYDSWSDYNRPLPPNFMDVVVAVDRRIGWDRPLGPQPSWWKVASQHTRTNPSGDFVFWRWDFSEPYQVWSRITPDPIGAPLEYYSLPSVWNQTFIEHLNVNGNVKYVMRAKWCATNSDGWYDLGITTIPGTSVDILELVMPVETDCPDHAGEFEISWNTLQGPIDTIGSNGWVWNEASGTALAPAPIPNVGETVNYMKFTYPGNEWFGVVDARDELRPQISAGPTGNGGFEIGLRFHDGTFLKQQLYVINDLGVVLDLRNYAGQELTQEQISSILDSINFEVVTTASEFRGRTIDSVISPKILEEFGKDN